MNICNKNAIEYDVDNKVTLQKCYINSDTDVLIILYKIFVTNELKLVFQRLTNSECQKYIKAGNLFVVVDKTNESSKEDSTKSKNESCSCSNKNGKMHVSDLDIHDGITRWTDKLFWTSSRMLHKKYLVYKQKKLVSEHRRLIKRTFSMKIDGRNIRLISYYDEESISDGSVVSVSQMFNTFFEEERTGEQSAQLEKFKKEVEDVNISGYSNSTSDKIKELDRMQRVHSLPDQRRKDQPKNVPQQTMPQDQIAYIQNGMVPIQNTLPINSYNPYLGVPVMTMPPTMPFIQGQHVPLPPQMPHNIYYVPQMPAYPNQDYQRQFIPPNMHPAYNPNMRNNMCMPFYQHPENTNINLLNSHVKKTTESQPKLHVNGKVVTVNKDNKSYVSTRPNKEESSTETTNSVKSNTTLPLSSKLPSIKDLQLPKL